MQLQAEKGETSSCVKVGGQELLGGRTEVDGGTAMHTDPRASGYRIKRVVTTRHPSCRHKTKTRLPFRETEANQYATHPPMMDATDDTKRGPVKSTGTVGLACS